MKGLKDLRDRILDPLMGSQSICFQNLYQMVRSLATISFNLEGESTTQVRDRMELTVRAIMESVAEDSESFLVSHGPSILQFGRRVLDPIPELRGLKNCCILHFTYDQGQFVLVLIYNPVEEEYIYGGEE